MSVAGIARGGTRGVPSRNRPRRRPRLGGVAGECYPSPRHREAESEGRRIPGLQVSRRSTSTNRLSPRRTNRRDARKPSACSTCRMSKSSWILPRFPFGDEDDEDDYENGIAPIHNSAPGSANLVTSVLRGVPEERYERAGLGPGWRRPGILPRRVHPSSFLRLVVGPNLGLDSVRWAMSPRL